MSGGGSGSQSTTQTQEPPSFLKPFLEQSAQAAAAEFEKGAPELFPGQTFVDFSPETLQALDLTSQFAQDNQLTKEAIDQTLGILSGSDDSIFQQAAEVASKPLIKSFQEATIPSLALGFSGQGRFGSGLFQSGVSSAQSNLLDQLSDVSTQFATQGAQQKLGAIGQLGQLSQQQFGDFAKLGAVGAAKEGQQQLALQDLINQFNFGQGSEAANIAQFQQLLQGSLGGLNLGSTTESSQQPGANPFTGALGGAASGATIGSAFGPIGTGVGAIGGGLLGAFSDRRIKENIKPVGKENGFNMYEFNYIGNPTRFIGVMAQEVEKIIPAAVTEVNGIKRVIYSMLGLEMRLV